MKQRSRDLRRSESAEEHLGPLGNMHGTADRGRRY